MYLVLFNFQTSKALPNIHETYLFIYLYLNIKSNVKKKKIVLPIYCLFSINKSKYMVICDLLLFGI